jgi:hypothetical protein
MKKPFGIIGLVCILGLAGPARAETLVPAVLEGGASWDASGNPYRVTQDVSLPQGATLLIGPDVQVELDQGRVLTIAGTLQVEGAEGHPVTFTHPAGAADSVRWGSVVFQAGSTPATASPGAGWSGSVIRHAVFEYATKAVRLEGASPAFLDCEFRHNRFVPESSLDQDGGAAMYIGPGSAPWVEGCAFDDNSCAKAAWGGAILADRAAPVIKDNRFTGNSSPYGGALTFRKCASPIVGNTFEGNQATFEGGAISLYSSQPALLNNLITGNQAFMDGGGVHTCIQCFPHANPLVMDNVITNNTSQDNNGLDTTGEPPGAGGFGAAFLRVFSHNDVFGNTRRGQPSDFHWRNHWVDLYPEWVNQVSLAGNWWGTADPTAIEAAILDGHDDPRLGTCDYSQVASGPVASPQTRVTITTRDLGYGTEGEPMPVYLTLYNPGPAREVDLLVTLRYSSGPPITYFDSFDMAPTGFPGGGVDAAAPSLCNFGACRLHMHANSVGFTTLSTAPFVSGSGLASVTWSASLFDPETGGRIGDVCGARAEFDWTEPLGGGE